MGFEKVPQGLRSLAGCRGRRDTSRRVSVIVVMIVVMVGRRNEGFWVEVAAMAGTATDRLTSVLQLTDVLRIDLLHHGDHQARRGLVRLGVEGEIEPGTAVGAGACGVGSVTCATFGAQSRSPLVHDFMDLLASEIFG